MDKIAGIEEVVQDIESVQRMQEKALKYWYLELYQNQFLYQKLGYLLWEHKERWDFQMIFESCKSK